MKDKYSVSIVMPTYNRKDIVNKHVKQLLYDQDYDKSKYELIVVDDGGIDGTADFLRETYKSEIEEGRLKVLRQKNHGLSTARNTGLKKATGNYICRIDDDDPPLPNRLKDSIEYFKENPDKRLVHGKSYWIDEQGNKLDNQKTFRQGLNMNRENLAEHHNLENKTEEYLLSEEDGKLVAGRNIVHGGTTLAHRTLYEDIEEKYGHIYDPTLTTSEDKDLWVRVAKLSKDRGKKEIGFMNKIVANYTFTEGQMKAETTKALKRKDLNSYINQKINAPKQFFHLVFSKSGLEDKTLRDYLHKVGRRGYRAGNKVKIVLRDPDSGKYKVRAVDSEVVMSKRENFFKRRLYEYDSLDELLKEHQIENPDLVEYVDGTHFQTEHKKLFKGNSPHRVTMLNEETFYKNERGEELIKGASDIMLHTKDNETLKEKLKKEDPEKNVKIWKPVLE